MFFLLLVLNLLIEMILPDGLGARKGVLFRCAAALVALAACLAAVALPAAAGPHDRLDQIDEKRERIDRKIDQARRRGASLQETIAGLDDEAEALQATISELDADIAELDADISTARAALTAAQQHLAALTEELLGIQSQLVDRTDVFTDRAVEAYKAGPAAPLDGLLSAESFSEFVDRYEYYESALDADAEILDEIEALRSATDQRRSEVEAEQERIAAVKLKLERNRSEVAGARAVKQDALDAQNALIAGKQSLLAEVAAKKSRLARLDAQLARDSARIKSLLAGASSSVSGPVGGGQLAWPANGPVTSGFGYRTHPIFGDTRLHAGIDIGASYGSPVWAADDGTVTYAGTMSGYGNVIVVDHGGGLATTYNHLSAFSVSSGMHVSRGRQVGNVGCTGYCTGPHLHFEVRINGTPVDPMPYLQ